MSTIVVDTINPYFIGGYVTLNGNEIKNNPNQTTIGIGNTALLNNTGANNVAIGKQSQQVSTSGSSNVSVGHSSLASITSDDNTAVGHAAGSSHVSGNNNIFIGRQVTGSTTTASNEITLGNSQNAVLRCAVTTITSLSDERDKKDIKDLPTGLDFLNGLRPVQFVWNEREKEGRKKIKDFGFIAQDLKKSQEEAKMADVLKLVYEENPEKLEASYGKLIPILVKAVQELSAKVSALESAK